MHVSMPASDNIYHQKIRPCLVPKKFSTAHRILEYMHGALNAVEKNNSLHSLTVNDERNLLSLISPKSNINCLITTKMLQYQNLKNFTN